MTFSRIREVCFPKPTAAEAPAFRDAVTLNNLHRERILAVLMIGVSIILMAVDFLVMDGGTRSMTLALAAIVARAFLTVFLLAFLIAGRRPTTEVSCRHRAWDVAFVGVSLSWVSLFTGALLVVRPGIEPYLISVFTIAAFLLQGAPRSALTFGAGLALFILSAVGCNPGQRVLLSALVNGCIATLLAFIISQVTFVMRLRSFRNDAYIFEQKRELMESNERLQRLSFVDPLTNIANRRFLEVSLSKEWKLQARSGLQLSVIMIDIDWFKSFNDTYGHLIGDDCLRRVATALEATVRRPTDLVSRFGGEEFCILLPMTDREGALFTGKRMMRAISGLNIPHKGSPLGRVSVSMGIAGCLPDHCRGYDDLLHSADTALYNAKISGKNRIAWCCPLLLVKKENEAGAPLPKSMPLSTDTLREPEFDVSPEASS
jgi:diguanylate cyclase (GGDEF)-like protein